MEEEAFSGIVGEEELQAGKESEASLLGKFMFSKDISI